MKLGALGTKLEEAINATAPAEVSALAPSTQTNPGEALLERLQQILRDFGMAGLDSEAPPMLVQRLRTATDKFVSEKATEPAGVHTGLRKAVRKVLYAAEAPVTTSGDFIRSVQDCLAVDQKALLQQFIGGLDGMIDSRGSGGRLNLEALPKLQALVQLEAAFFNPQFGVDFDLFNLLGMDDRPLTISEAQDVLEEAVLSRAQRLKAVTIQTVEPKIIDDFAARLLTLLKTVLQPKSGLVGTA